MHSLTEDQIFQLAPDPASLKAGKELANDKKWLSFAYNTRVLWGEIKGSGSSPYRTQIDLQQIAFKCSCPSRKFPCKHGLGLFLLSARFPDRFRQSADEPDWVQEWMDKRSAKADKTPAGLPPADDEQKSARQAREKARRQHERLLKVQGGMDELERWLKDLVRTGLLTAPEKGPEFWEKTAARMVDAQAPGIGNRVKQLGAINFVSGNGWQEMLLQGVSDLYLLLEAFKNLAALPPPLQEDVRTLIGWNTSQKELLEDSPAETISDTWLVLGRITEVQDDLTIQRNWLYGAASGRYALLLNFAYKNTPITTLLAPETAVQAQLTFYPGNYPLRAVIREQGPTLSESISVTPLPHWDAAQDIYAAALSRLPWADDIPMTVAELTPVPRASGWLLRDQQDYFLPLAPGFEEKRLLELLAFSGGLPLDMFLLRSHNAVLPVGFWYEGRYRSL